MRTPRVLVLLTALLLVATGCGSNGSEGPPQAPASAAGGEALTTEELVEAFAAAGIGTFESAASAAPMVEVDDASPAAYTLWQVENMARQLHGHRGYLGRDLDALTGTEVPMSVVLAAYVVAGDTPGAEVARRIMGEQDFERHALDLVYPDAVVALFVNDVARDASAGDGSSGGAAGGSGGAVVKPAVLAGGLCTDLQNLLSNTLSSIVDALTINATEGVGGVLATIWNTVISIAASAAQLVLDQLTAPLLGLIKGAMTLLAVLSSASSLLDPWTVEMTAEPNPVSFGIEPAAGNEVTVTTSVASGIDFTWPKDLVDCAGAAGVDLPDPGSAKGSPVSWTYVDNSGVTQPGDRDAVVDEQGTARLHFTTLTESAEDAASGDLVISPVGVKADLKRLAVSKLLAMVNKVVLGALPEAVQGIIAQLLGPVQGAAQQKLEELVQASGKMTWVDVHHHGAAKQTPSPVAPTGCASVEGVLELADGTFAGPIELDVVGQHKAGAVAVSKGKGQLQLTVAEGKVTGGEWQLSWHSVGDSQANGAKVHLEVDGAVAGKVGGTAAEPVVSGTWTLKGTAKATAFGVTQEVPINESGKDSETLTLEKTTCDDVTATFVPSFNAKSAERVIDGIATWTGTRVE